MKNNYLWNQVKEFLIKQRKIIICNNIFRLEIEYNFIRIIFPILLILEAILLGLITGEALYN